MNLKSLDTFFLISGKKEQEELALIVDNTDEEVPMR